MERLSLRDLADLCTRVTASTHGATSMEAAASALVRCLREVFVDPVTGRPDLVLARAFQTAPWSALPADLQGYVDRRLAPGRERPQRCLVLLGTDGDDPRWCDRRTSHDHRALPLWGAEALRESPMVSALVDQFGVSLETFLHGDGPDNRTGPDHPSAQPGFEVFFVPEAAGSAEVPAQDFVREHGVASVVGFGGLLPGGDVFGVIAFSRTPVTADVATLFGSVAVAAKLALLPFVPAPLFEGGPERPHDAVTLVSARMRALEEMLAVQQRTVAIQAASLEDALDEAVRMSNEAQREAAANEALREVTGMLSAELDLDRLVQTATDAATRITGAAFGAFFYNVVKDGERYTLYTISGLPRSAFDRFPQPRPTAIFRPTFEGTEIIRSDDITQDPRYGHNAPYYGLPEGHPPVRSHLAVPVVARSGEVHGGFFFGHPDKGVFDDRAERLVVGIAAQAAIALDNARLYEAERSTALTLQRSLLPQVVDVPEGLEIAYQYLPGGRGLDVGGDWFDVIPLSGGRTAFVIGDVMGKGVRAAAVMGQLRTAIRAYTVSDLPPDVLISRLNRLVLDLGEDLIATAVYAVLNQNDDVLTVASAGHLPPAFVDPAGNVTLPTLAGGPPLGVPDALHQHSEVAFPAGTRLLLFTDGLVEHRGRPLGEGLDTLATLLGALQGSSDVVCKDLIEGLLDEDTQDDDVTLLMVTNSGVCRKQYAEREFSPDRAQAAAARRFVDWVLVGWEDEEHAEVVVTTVNEMLINSLVHAATPVTVRLRRLPRLIVAEVEDLDAHQPRRAEAGPDDEDHRGLQIVEELSTRWGSRPTESGKVVWAEFATDPPAEPG